VLCLKARAKVNLWLEVIGLRQDGFHDILTLFHQIDLADTVKLSDTGPGGPVRCFSDSDAVPAGLENIAAGAAVVLARKAGCDRGADIDIGKRIPVAAGLAGGSADAAAVLAGLNQLWGCGFSPEELQSLGRELGSDVPFCLLGGTAVGRGRGDRLEPVAPGCRPGVVLACPPLPVSTATAYSELDRFRRNTGLRPTGDEGLAAAVRSLERGDMAGLAPALHNAFDAWAQARYPLLARLKRDMLAAGALGALVSGTGPTVLGLAKDVQEARFVAARLRDRAGIEAGNGLGDGVGNGLWVWP